MSASIPSLAAPRLGPNLAAAVRRAIGHLVAGGVVIAPTESGYGLFAVVANTVAVRRVCEIKGRTEGQALPVVVADGAGFAQVAEPPGEADERLMAHFWPGPLTLVVRARPGVPEEVTRGFGTVGVRIPPHPVAGALCHAVGPLTATSANLAGGPLARSAAEIDPALLADDVLVIDGGLCTGEPSTVASLSDDGDVTILRPGPVTEHQIRAVLGR